MAGLLLKPTGRQDTGRKSGFLAVPRPLSLIILKQRESPAAYDFKLIGQGKAWAEVWRRVATPCMASDDASAEVALLTPRQQAEEATGILGKWNPQEQQNHIISLREQRRTNAAHREESPAMETRAGYSVDTADRAESQGFCRGGTFKDLLSQRPSHRIRDRRPREGRTCLRPHGE